MRYFRYLVLLLVALVLVSLTLANRDWVTLRLVPDNIANLVGLPWAAAGVSLPIFVVILVTLTIGMILGYSAEWVREFKFRAAASRDRREKARLAKEIAQMKTDKADGDDVLALLDDSGGAR